MATISSLGLGSGLDLNGLLDKLTKAEQQRLTPYTTQQTSYNAQLTAYGTLKSSLEKFDNLSKDLAKPEFFNSTTATKHDQFTVTTTDKSVPGNYSIEVLKLAQPQTLTTQTPIADQQAKLGTSAATIALSASPPATRRKRPRSRSATIRLRWSKCATPSISRNPALPPASCASATMTISWH